MKTICCKCQAELKYPVTIDGKIYGTSCASTYLGINDIPKHFTGDYTAWKKDKNDKDAIEAEKYAIHKANVDLWIVKYAEDVKRISKAWFNNNANEWETRFIRSLSKQIDLPILGDVREWSNTKYKYGIMKFEPRGLKSLSQKQLAIFERIENK